MPVQRQARASTTPSRAHRGRSGAHLHRPFLLAAARALATSAKTDSGDCRRSAVAEAASVIGLRQWSRIMTGANDKRTRTVQEAVTKTCSSPRPRSSAHRASTSPQQQEEFGRCTTPRSRDGEGGEGVGAARIRKSGSDQEDGSAPFVGSDTGILGLTPVERTAMHHQTPPHIAAKSPASTCASRSTTTRSDGSRRRRRQRRPRVRSQSRPSSISRRGRSSADEEQHFRNTRFPNARWCTKCRTATGQRGKRVSTGQMHNDHTTTCGPPSTRPLAVAMPSAGGKTRIGTCARYKRCRTTEGKSKG